MEQTLCKHNFDVSIGKCAICMSESFNEEKLKELEKMMPPDEEINKKLIKILESTTLNLLILEYACTAQTKNLKEKDPETYYTIKSTVRDLLECMKDQLPKYQDLIRKL